MKKLTLLLAQLFCHHKYQYTEINHDGLNTMECKWRGKKKVVKVLSLLALAFVVCCCSTDTAKDDTEYLHPNNENRTISPKIVLIDSCEYIECYSIGGTQSMVWTEPIYIHKGNCKYCAERRKKEQEELIRKLKED